MNFLQEKFVFNNKNICIKTRIVSADKPAFAYICGVTYFNGFGSYQRFLVKGRYVKRRVCFAQQDAQLRSDESYSLKLDTSYHEKDSELKNFKMISQIPQEYMHSVCLGAMRKCIELIFLTILLTKIPKLKKKM